MDADVRAAVLKSHLHELPLDVVEELLTGAVRMKIPAGSVTHREGEPAPHLELVISGVVRGFVTAPDGRTMTVRYCPARRAHRRRIAVRQAASPCRRRRRHWWTPSS